MSWQLSIAALMIGLTYLFYWLSFQYDKKEHAVLKLFYTMMGWVMVIASVLGAWLLIPSSETALLDYYNTFLLIAITLLILVFLYWFGYISLSIGKGLLKQMWGDLRSVQNNPRKMRFYVGKK